MRRLTILLLGSLAACSSCASKRAPDEAPTAAPQGSHDPKTRVLYRQFYAGSRPLVLENLAGRDLTELRSKAVAPGEAPVGYCPDDVMRELLRNFKRFDFQDYARPVPADPSRFGVAELTIVDASGRRMGMLRTRAPAGGPTEAYRKESQAYQKCVATFLNVYNFHSPTLQVTAGKGEFGAHRVER